MQFVGGLDRWLQVVNEVGQLGVVGLALQKRANLGVDDLHCNTL